MLKSAIAQSEVVLITVLKRFLKQLLSNEISWQEKIFSSVAAFMAIFGLSSLIDTLLPIHVFNPLILASMGASTFLLFVVPHSPLAQPWPFSAGHITAGFIGVTCCQLIPDMTLALATAVSLSVLIMYGLNCMHPPAAATAMIAIIGGEKVIGQGWSFAYATVAINVAILLTLTLLLNNLIPGRRYPLNHQHHPHHKMFQRNTALRHRQLYENDFRWALSQMNSYIDVTEEDLVDLYEFALEHAQKRGSSRH